jgi:hypothetical protein
MKKEGESYEPSPICYELTLILTDTAYNLEIVINFLVAFFCSLTYPVHSCF